MTKQVQRRRGTATQHTSFTGAEGEISVNTTNKSIHVHDGVTAGGIEGARADMTNVSDGDLNSRLAGNTLSSLTITSADINGGAIDGTVIGGTTPAAGNFTTGSFTGNATFGDNDKAIFGAGSDLQIYHDGVTSVIQETGSGDLRLKGTNIDFKSATNETYAYFQADGPSILYHNSSDKLATTATGINVTGTIAADGLTVNSGTASSNLTIRNTGTSYLNIYADTNGVTILDVDSGNTGAAPRFQIDVGEAQAFRIQEGGDISFYEDTGTTPKFFWDASAESLGIGTSSPSTALHVVDSGNPTITLSGSDGAYTSILDLKAAGGGGSVISANGGSNSLIFNTNSAERMRIDSAGRVGIGTSTPSTWLDVDGTSSGAVRIKHLYSYAQPNWAIKMDGQTGTPAGYLSQSGASGGFALASGAVYYGGGNYLADANATAYSGIEATNGEIRFRTATGLTPGQVFSGGEAMRIDSSGNVGIGTSSPSEVLQLNGATNAQIRMQPSASGTSGFINTTAGSTKGMVQYNHSSDYMRIYTNGSERMRIDSSGNLLVGNTEANPASGNVAGVRLSSANSQFSADGATPVYINRKTGDGTLIDFRKDGTTVGSIGVTSSQLEIDASASNLVFKNPTRTMAFSSGALAGSGSANDAVIDLGISNRRFKDLYLSGGVYLGGTGAANKLDDYEEGTWTATLRGGTSEPATLVTTTGKYTKVGRNVTFQVEFNGVNTTGYSGEATIQGLPFNTVSAFRHTFTTSTYSMLTFSETLTSVISSNSSTIQPISNRTGTSWQASQHNAGGSRFLVVTGTYLTA